MLRKTFVVAMILLVKDVSAQYDLTGIWKLREKQSLQGPDYTNAVPQFMKIQQSQDVVTIEITSSLLDKDTVYNENLQIGNNRINEMKTSNGGKKSITIAWDSLQKVWQKRSILFDLENPSKKIRNAEEKIAVVGNVLTLDKISTALDGAKESDYAVKGVYDKITNEELTKETAKGNGLIFVQGLSWEQIRAKAKKEKKFIFVDCYATWCAPCKAMDRDVFPLNMVGDAMREKFIAVKIQMDTTKRDDANVKLLYSSARILEKTYSITALPTYLFFNSDGSPVHKAVGQQKPFDFLKQVDIVFRKPDEQLYTLVGRLKNHQIPYSAYPSLAKTLRDQFGENTLAAEVAKIYKEEYLDKLSEKEILAKTHLDFIGEYFKLIQPTDYFFKVCYEQPDLVDRIKEYKSGSWADWQVEQTITRVYIQPFISKFEKTAKEPDWKNLEIQFQKRYNKEKAITWTLDARVAWYEKNKKWDAYIKYLPDQMARHNIDRIVNALALNSAAWNVFVFSDDKQLMNKALDWVESALNRLSGELMEDMVKDTKVWLLYKVGRKQEAMELLQTMIARYPEGHHNIKAMAVSLELIRQGKPVWLKYAATANGGN